MGKLLFHCIELVSSTVYVFGGLLLHGVWDSFADFPYGIFLNPFLLYLYICIFAIKLQIINKINKFPLFLLSVLLLLLLF